MLTQCFFSTHCINDFDLGESELSGGNCEERRELKPNGNVSDHDTVIISQHEVINNITIRVCQSQARSPMMGTQVFIITLLVHLGPLRCPTTGTATLTPTSTLRRGISQAWPGWSSAVMESTILQTGWSLT